MSSSQISTHDFHQSENYVCCLIITVALSYTHISLDAVNRAAGGVDGGDRPTRGKKLRGKSTLSFMCRCSDRAPCLLNMIQQAVRYAP